MQQKLIPASAVQELFGGVSAMWIHRRLKDPEANFPRPLYIARRRFWNESDILDWIESQKEAA